MTSPGRIMLGDTVAKSRYHVTRESLVRYAGRPAISTPFTTGTTSRTPWDCPVCSRTEC